MQVDVQEVGSLDIDGQLLTIPCWWVKGNTNGELLTVHNWPWTVNGSGLSIVDCPNFDGADAIDPLLLVNSWQSTVEHQLLLIKCWWIWSVKSWQSKFRWWTCWLFTMVGWLSAVHWRPSGHQLLMINNNWIIFDEKVECFKKNVK